MPLATNAHSTALNIGNSWHNLDSGFGARNGTNTHTIGGSAPSPGCALGFVPTVGRLLVVFVAGPVTHTSSGTGAGSGWVEREQPVNSNELSMFTKVASGDDFLTVTHNGTDYPINWVFYEFPAGSTYTMSTSYTSSDDVWTAFTGLPGDPPQFVVAAYCHGFPANGVLSGCTTATAPWVEDSDSMSVGGPTGNNYLFTFHLQGVTAVSTTPTASTSLTGTMNTDRQKIVAAFTLKSVYSYP
jgi:hypothetical protein